MRLRWVLIECRKFLAPPSSSLFSTTFSRDVIANSSWKWLIDVIGALLVVISMTGLLLQLFLRKRRRSALASAAIGAILSLLFAYLTLR